jgi:hypothetical protein
MRSKGGKISFKEQVEVVTNVETKEESDDARYGKRCNVGNEYGVTCDSEKNCSTHELVNGCCILGKCLNH